jgi:ribosomal-protein-alanine N-acetyltransferase
VTTVELVPMTDAHVDLLMPYEKQMFGTEAWTAGGYRAELADTENRYYVAPVDADGGLLGWAGLMAISGAAEILTVGTVPTARRQGIATRLVHELIDEAKRRQAFEMFLEVRVDNESARALYDHEGFVEIGRRRGYYDHGRVDAVVMRKELSEAVQDA